MTQAVKIVEITFRLGCFSVNWCDWLGLEIVSRIVNTDLGNIPHPFGQLLELNEIFSSFLTLFESMFLEPIIRTINLLLLEKLANLQRNFYINYRGSLTLVQFIFLM